MRGRGGIVVVLGDESLGSGLREIVDINAKTDLLRHRVSTWHAGMAIVDQNFNGMRGDRMRSKGTGIEFLNGMRYPNALLRLLALNARIK